MSNAKRFDIFERLDALGRLWEACDSCALGATRIKLAMWRGSPTAGVFMIGEAPGVDEDASGVPFVGRAGRKLDDLIREAAMDPAEDVFIANMVACRPPNNRKPEREETSACAPRLQAMLKAVAPKVLVLLGSTAARLAGIKQITPWRGQLVEVEMLLWNGSVAEWHAVPTFHPSYLLRSGNSPKIRGQMVSDLKLAKRIAHGD